MIRNGNGLYGIIGGKLSHSLSPKLMNHLAIKLNRDERFRAIELGAESLLDFFDELKDASRAGLNVTQPLKEAVIEYLDELSGDAEDAHAVNIIVSSHGKLKGYNSDIAGFQRPEGFLEDIAKENSNRGEEPVVLILGSGGAAAAATVGLLRLWSDLKIVYLARSHEKLFRRVGRLQARFPDNSSSLMAVESTQEALSRVFTRKGVAALLINATPVGQWPDAGQDPFQPFGFSDNELVDFYAYYDVVYNPGRTSAMNKMAHLGAKVTGGIDWFCRQALLSAELFFGKRPSEEEVRSFVEKELTRS